MPMTLYNLNLSPFSSRVRLQIRAKGLENEVLIVDRPAVEEYRLMTPTGKVPCLDTGAGFNLPESETIAEFIEDSFAEPSLRGHTVLGKAKVRLLSRLVDLYHIPAFFEVFGLMQSTTRDAEKIQAAWDKVSTALGYIEAYLEGPVYATQGRLTLADCALVPALFFHTALEPAFGRTAFQGHEKAGAYFNAISGQDSQVARIIEEMADGLKQMMAQRAAAANG